MKLTINGNAKEIEPVENLEQLVQILVEKNQGLIVELNDNIITRDAWKRQTVQDGDAIELIRFVGGG
jgi:sulfur carrier protein